MATYILFWNPEISSYTKERFLEDFAETEGVGNWSFHEHEKVKFGDTFFMVKCGGGKTGIVMRGTIYSECYEDEDWSPKNRRHIYYADIYTEACVNPWSDAPLLSAERLTAEIPGFDWTGGHSGRRLDPASARRLDSLWFEYLDGSQKMLCDNDAWIAKYASDAPVSKTEARKLDTRHRHSCEVCGYSYIRLFGREAVTTQQIYCTPVISPSLRRVFFNICANCSLMPNDVLAAKLAGSGR